MTPEWGDIETENGSHLIFPQVEESQLHLSCDFTFTFHLEQEMATHSSVLAWRIPGTGEPGGLLSMGSQSRTRLKRLSSSSSASSCRAALGEPVSSSASQLPISYVSLSVDSFLFRLARIIHFCLQSKSPR